MRRKNISLPYPTLIGMLVLFLAVEGVFVVSSAPNVTTTTLSPGLTNNFVDINPNESGFSKQDGISGNCPSPCPSGGSGGRVNGLSPVPGDPLTYFAASELGGLFKSTDGGDTWYHLDGHLPTRAWDVAAAPGGQRVFATSFFDYRKESLSGIEVSKDGGVTWSRPPITMPVTCPSFRAAQPSAFGIALRRGAPNDVFVGTNCGIARSMNSGDNWTQFDPTPDLTQYDPTPGEATSVWDIVALAGGQTYACGTDGFLSSPDGQSWVNLGKPFTETGTFCSLAVSPDEPNVIFVVFASPGFGELFAAGRSNYYEGLVQFDNVGTAITVSWTLLPNPDFDFYNPPVRKARVPFVVTNDRTVGFDLWLGEGNMFRLSCDTPVGPGTRCPTDKNQWGETFTDGLGDFNKAHGDSGDLEFNPMQSVDACPTLYSSDGGIYRNNKMSSPDCHDEAQFMPANVGVHAELLWGMAGVHRPGVAEEDLYMVTQDVGVFSTFKAGAPAVTWTQGVGGDAFDVTADLTNVVVSQFALWAGDPGFQNMKGVVGDPPWSKINQGLSDIIAQSGPGQYLIASRGYTDVITGVLVTNNIFLNPLGSPLGTWPAAANLPCHIRVSQGPTGPQPYVLTHPFAVCDWNTPDQLWTFKTGNWISIPVPAATAGAGFSMFAVDPVNPNRLYAAVIGDGAPRMVRSSNSGISWTVDLPLTDLMYGNGKFLIPTLNVGDGVWTPIQPTLVAFDPGNPNLIVAGGRESGVFVSSDAGMHWALLTDPFTPGTSHIPHIPRPFFAHFDHDPPGLINIFIGTVGRGVWRIELANDDVSVTKSAAMNPIIAGTNETYTLTVTNNGPADAQNVTLTDPLPPHTTFVSLTQSGPAFNCTMPTLGGTGTVTCSIGMLPAGISTTFSLVVGVDPSVPDGAAITNTAQVWSAMNDTIQTNNSSSVTVTVITSADLAVTKTQAANIVIPDIAQTYTMTLTNNGPSDAQNVVLSDTLPLGTTFVSFTQNSVPTFTCTTLFVGGTGTLNCTLATLAAGQTVSFTLGVRINPLDINSITNTVVVTSTTVDPNPTNNTASVTAQVSAKAWKQRILTDLIALRTEVTDKQIVQKLDQAIKSLSDSLESSLWASNNTLEDKHGEKVFVEEKNTVQFLSDLLPSFPAELAPALQGIVNRLVLADHALADVAIHQAMSASGSANLITLAQEELAQGDSHTSAGDYAMAVQDYRNGWLHALQAMKK